MTEHQSPPCASSEVIRVVTDVDHDARTITICDVVGRDAALRYAELCRRATTSRYWKRRRRWIDRRGGYSEDFIFIRGFYDRVAP